MRSTSLSSRPISHHTQSGVALIVVLLFLILIMIIGAIAVRQASVDLNVATSDQVGTLLMNNSDSVLAHIEESTKQPSGPNYERIMQQKFGVMGYFTVNSQDKVGTQISFCYRPSLPEVFNVGRAFIRPLGNSTNSAEQSCNPDSTADYSSARNTAMTQIIIKGTVDENSQNFNSAARGTSEGGQTHKASPSIQLNSISVLPAMSDKSAAEIKKCLGKPVGNANDYGIHDGNINDCLRQNSIPSTFVVEDGLLKDEEVGGYNGTQIDDPCATDANCKAALAAPNP